MPAVAAILAVCSFPPAVSVAAPLAPAAPETPRQNHAAPPQTDTTVSGLTVTATKGTPRVVSTFPAQGATVAAGVLVMRATFSQPMEGESWSYVTSRDGDYPDCADAPRLLDDRKSFVLICRTLQNKSYAIWFNHDPYDNFTNLGRKPSPPFELKFSTSDAAPVWTLSDAMKLDPALPAGSNPAEAEGKRRLDEGGAP